MNSLIGGFLLPSTFITRNININGGVTLLNLPSVISSSQTLTTSYVSNRSFSSISSSFTTRSISASFSIIAQTSSFILNDFVDTGSFMVTSSGALTNRTASSALTSSKAIGTSSVTYSLTSSWASSSVSASYSIGALGGKVYPVSSSLYIPYDDTSPVSNKTILLKVGSTYISCSSTPQIASAQAQAISIVSTSSIGRNAQFQSVIIGTNLFITQSNSFNGCYIGNDMTVGDNSPGVLIGNKINYATRNRINLQIIGSSCVIGHNFASNLVFPYIRYGNVIIGNHVADNGSNTSIDGNYNVFIGNYCGYNLFNSNNAHGNNVFIGNNCAYNSSASGQLYIGNNCGYNSQLFGVLGESNILLGHNCAFNYTGFDENILIGNSIGVGNNPSAGSKTISIGNNIETNGYANCIILGNYATASGVGQLVIGSQQCPIQTSSVATIGSACPTLHSGSKFVIININGTPYKIACFNL